MDDVTTAPASPSPVFSKKADVSDCAKGLLDKKNLMENEPTEQAGWTFFLVYSIIASVLGTSFMYGYNSGVVNPAYDVITGFINETFTENYGRSLEKTELNTYWSLVVTFFVIGGIIGSMWFPDTEANRFGRKKSILFNSVIGVVGGLICFIAPYTGSFITLMVGRAVVGFHSGVVMVIVPALLVELAPVHLRGACGSFTELTLILGVSFSHLVGIGHVLGTENLWHYLFLLAVFVYLIHGIMLIFGAESPRWLVDKNRDEEALEELRKLRKSSETAIMSELEATRELSKEEASIKAISFIGLFSSRQLWWPLILSINLHCSQQLTGIGAVMYYATEVMSKAGFDDQTAEIANFAVSLCNIVTTVISAVIVDKVGRRILILISLTGMGIAHIFLTIVLSFKVYYATIAGFAVFLLTFSIGAGPICWYMTAEMFAQSARPAALSACLLVNWLTNLTVGLLFPHMMHYMNEYAFLPFALWSFFEFIFLFLFLPETSSISLEEVVAKFAPGQPFLQCFKKQQTSQKTAHADEEPNVASTSAL